MRLRLRRGFLASAAEGHASSHAAADFERCLELVGTDLREADLVATLTALWAYYLPRGDLRRTIQVSDSIRRQIPTDRRWFRSLINTAYGMVAWYSGDFAEARELLEEDISGIASLARPSHRIGGGLCLTSRSHRGTHVALARFVQGDFSGAEEQLDEAVRRTDTLGFPQGPFSHDYERCYEIWMRIESGQLDRAGEIVSQLATDATRHGFEFWALMAGAQQVAVQRARAAGLRRPGPGPASDPHRDHAVRRAELARRGGEAVACRSDDAALAQLLARQQANATVPAKRLDIALQLGDETGVNFYRAELLRLRAQTTDDADARDADLNAAIETAREQQAPIFELRAALDAFKLRGEHSRNTLSAAIGRFPAASEWPDLARARALLG